MFKGDASMTDGWLAVFIDDKGRLWGSYLNSKVEVEEYLRSDDSNMNRITYGEFVAAMFSAIEVQKLAFIMVIHYDKGLFEYHLKNMGRLK
jgi:hypothetical protein